LTLWECDELETKKEIGFNWNTIGTELLDELFVRQIKLVFNEYPSLINNKNDTFKEKKVRLHHSWNATVLSRRLFMFECFFIKNICGLFGKNCTKITPKLKYFEYNEETLDVSNNKSYHYGLKLQEFSSKVYLCSNYKEFFELIGLKYVGLNTMSDWLLNCSFKSRERYYHKPHVYYSKLKQIEAFKEMEQEMK